MKIFDTLRQSGRLAIEIDYHKMFNETATEVIERNTDREYSYCSADTLECMKKNDCIIKVEFAPIDKPMPVVVQHHFNLEQALKNTYKAYKKWKPQKENA